MPCSRKTTLNTKRGSHPAKAKRFKTNMDDKKPEEVAAPEVVIAPPVVEVPDPIAEKDAKIAKLSEDLANYKHVALKRLGKLPGDADFVAGIDEKTGLTVEETVRKTLIEQDLIRTEQEKNVEISKLQTKVSELTRALKNRPGAPVGGGGGDSPDVKDNVFSESQLVALRATATRLKADPEKFIEAAKKNLQAHR